LEYHQLSPQRPTPLVERSTLMQYQKNEQTFSSYDIRQLHPHVSFCKSTYEELGYTLYIPEVIEPTAQEIAEAVKQRIIMLIQQRLDTFAQSRGYDGILSACTYATSQVPKYQQEGQYCVNIRDQTWYAAYQIMEAVVAGTRSLPSGYEEIESELPVLEWPVAT
jgi:hypothetical protein